MVWKAPAVTRVDEPFAADERSTLVALLEWQRDTLLHKCTGLTGEELVQRSAPPSSLSLLGLVRHMAKVERVWFRMRFAGEDVPWIYPRGTDADFDELDPARAEEDYAMLVTEQERARAAVEGASLEDTFEHQEHGPMSLRWVYLHMIEEYARHNGHADLLRERIDGVTET